ncbi:MAG: substrate-binding domain-containing protein, partial [Candidatus Methylomirabilales bacterium]
VAGKTIGFSMSWTTTEWVVQQHRGVDEMAAKYGMKVIAFDAGDNPAKEVTNLEDLVTRKVDVIIISTYYAEAITPAIRTINQAGIPIVVLSSSLATGTNFNSHLSVDTLATAREAGKVFVQKLGGKGKIVQIEGKPGSVVNQMRGRGFHEVIDKEKGIEVVAHVVANYERGQALRAMEDILRAQPKIDAVYCHNNEMALGAIKATKEAGRAKEMWFVGYDGLTLEELQAVYNGDLYGCFYYLPFGAEGVEVAVRILRGQKVPKEIVFPSPFMSKENITEWYDPATKSRKLVVPRAIPEA